MAPPGAPPAQLEQAGAGAAQAGAMGDELTIAASPQVCGPRQPNKPQNPRPAARRSFRDIVVSFQEPFDQPTGANRPRPRTVAVQVGHCRAVRRGFSRESTVAAEANEADEIGWVPLSLSLHKR